MFFSLLEQISNWAIPFFILVIPLYGYIRRVQVFDVFIEGAAEGLKTAFKILPFLLGMLVAINIFRSTGGMNILLCLLSPVTNCLPIPADVLPLAIMRPISGSGAQAILVDIFTQYGPDSLVGRMASAMQGSTDTTFFILTVYFGSVGIRKIRYSLITGLIADLAGFIAAVIICFYLFA